MSTKKKVAVITLAAAAALAFATAPVTSATARSYNSKVKCFGVNGCKGKSSCQTARSSCKGLNSCKGKGHVVVVSKKVCKQLGGKTRRRR